MTAAVKGILTKLEKIDTDRIGSELLETLKGANALVKNANELMGGEDVRGAVRDLKGSLDAFQSILRKMDHRVEPVMANLETAIGAGHDTLQRAQTTLQLLDRVLKPDSPLQYKIIELSEELSEMARSIRTLLDLLERHPNALIFGKKPSGEK
jgi:paraquat-inducible protein B